MRRATEKKDKKRMLKELEKKSKELSKELSHVSDEEVVELIRGDRESR